MSLAATAERPLVVDLDGTLVKTDLLVESASAFLVARPLHMLWLLGWLVRGRAVLKAQLAEAATIDVATLPYNQELLAWLEQEKARGRSLVLATASHRRLADAVAGHLQLFDRVLATDGTLNLKSEAKRDALVGLYGDGGYDYVGDAGADAAVWQSAGQAHAVTRSGRLPSVLRDHPNPGRAIRAATSLPAAALVRAMRPHQWLKNLLLFVPLVAAQRSGEPGAWVQALLGFLAFGLVASSVYLFNDLADVKADRHHARKRHRPFASGELAVLHGWIAWPLLLGAGLALSLLALPRPFAATLVLYACTSTLYSLWFKQVPVLDVLVLAGLYTLRIIAGAAAIDVPVSFWLLSFSMFLFLSLAFMKRFSELQAARDAEQAEPLRGRGYGPRDLELVAGLGAAAGQVAVLVLALYVHDPRTAALYAEPRLVWLACPLLLYWILRAWLLAHRGQVNQDPILFAVQDRVSWIVVLLLGGVFALAKVAW